jgi:hypothetical protein
MADAAGALRDAGTRLADLVAEWFDRQGPEIFGSTLADRDATGRWVKKMEPADRAVCYAAAACGVSRARFYQLRAFGQIRQILVSGQIDRCLPVVDIGEVPERTLRPLSRLLAADRAADVPEAFRFAVERFERRKADAEIAGKTPPKRLTSADTTNAVVALLGRPEPRRGGSVSSRPGSPAEAEGHEAADTAWDAAAMLDRAFEIASALGAPEDTIQDLNELRRRIAEWAEDAE